MAADGSAGRGDRARDTAARLREAARDVFGELGYSTARVEDIVQSAGVSHGTFYTYYANKAAVLEALVRDSADRLLAVAAASWEDTDVDRALRRVIGDILDVFAEEADVIRVWLEAAATEAEFAGLLREVRTQFADRVGENLAPLTAGTDHDERVAASALVGMVEGYATGRYQQATTAEREAAVHTLATIWSGALQRLISERDAVSR